MIHKLNYFEATHKIYNNIFITDIRDKNFTELVNPITEKHILEFPFDEIKLRESDDVRYSKVYYYANENVYANDVKKTEFKRSFGFYTFFDPEYITRPGFVFKLNGEWYHFITNCEFALQFAITENEKKVHIYFNPDENNKTIYKIAKGYKELHPKYFVYMYELDNLTSMLMNYFLFDGIRFLPKKDLPYVAEEKKKLIEVLKGLDFYFIGTSIYDYAKDIDIHINEKDAKEAIQRLDKLEYFKNDLTGYSGCQYKNEKTGINIDLMISPYSNFVESKIGYDAEPLLMYFIQVNYFCSIFNDNLTTLFKEYRYNKVRISQKTIGINFEKYGQYVNQVIPNERLVNYIETINNLNKTKIIHENNIFRYMIMVDDEWEYLVVSMKNKIYTDATIKLPYNVTDLTVIDDTNNLTALVTNKENEIDINLSGIDYVAAIKYKPVK